RGPAVSVVAAMGDQGDRRARKGLHDVGEHPAKLPYYTCLDTTRSSSTHAVRVESTSDFMRLYSWARCDLAVPPGRRRAREPAPTGSTDMSNAAGVRHPMGWAHLRSTALSDPHPRWPVGRSDVRESRASMARHRTARHRVRGRHESGGSSPQAPRALPRPPAAPRL